MLFRGIQLLADVVAGTCIYGSHLPCLSEEGNPSATREGSLANRSIWLIAVVVGIVRVSAQREAIK